MISVRDETVTRFFYNPFVSIFNPKNREVFGILKNNMDFFSDDITCTMKRVMENTKLIKSKRQHPNLKCLFTKSKLQDNNNCTLCVCKCKAPCFGLCNYIFKWPSLTLNNKTFHVKESMNCRLETYFMYLYVTVALSTT